MQLIWWWNTCFVGYLVEDKIQKYLLGRWEQTVLHSSIRTILIKLQDRGYSHDLNQSRGEDKIPEEDIQGSHWLPVLNSVGIESKHDLKDHETVYQFQNGSRNARSAFHAVQFVSSWPTSSQTSCVPSHLRCKQIGWQSSKYHLDCWLCNIIWICT